MVFSVPDRCAQCNELGSVRLAHALKGTIVIVDWRCRLCHHSWPVMLTERLEMRTKPDRRTATTDRRRTSRSDRRR